MSTIKATAPGIAPGAQLPTEDTAVQSAIDDTRASSCAEYARVGLSRTNPDLPHPAAVLEQACRTTNDSRCLGTAPEFAPQIQGRAAELIAAGYYVAPAHGYALLTPDVDPRKEPYTAEEAGRGSDLHIYLGEMRTGRMLYMLDLDSHKKGQNADAAREAFKAARPELESKIEWHPSQSGTGCHGFFISSKRLDTGKLYDAADNHIGELLGADTDRTLDPGDLHPPALHNGEVERLFNVWHVKASDPKGQQWKDRAKQGASWTRGYQHIPVTQQQLRTFLQNECGRVGKQLDTYFDHAPDDRSAEAGNLMQCLMLHAHKLPGCANAPFTVRCANVLAYAIAADAYGKAGEKGYAFEKDAASLIAQIASGDPYGDGRRWIIPFWAKGQSANTPAPAAAPTTPPTRPAHRPAGDRAKHLATFRRVLSAIEPDDFGRRIYTLEQLTDKMKAARCPAKPRTIQSYLKTLRGDAGTTGEIVTAQIGGNGMPYAVLTRCFGGADNYQKRVEIPLESPPIGGADPIAEQRVLTPEIAELSRVCKEDHQNTCVPTDPPPGAPLTVEGLVTRDMAIMSVLYADLRPLTPDERAKNRKPKQRRFIPRKEQRIDLRFTKAHGDAPAPTPYRPRAAPLTLESLPEPPAAAAPAGAYGFGAPLHPTPESAPPDLATMNERAFGAFRARYATR